MPKKMKEIITKQVEPTAENAQQVQNLAKLGLARQNPDEDEAWMSRSVLDVPSVQNRLTEAYAEQLGFRRHYMGAWAVDAALRGVAIMDPGKKTWLVNSFMLDEDAMPLGSEGYTMTAQGLAVATADLAQQIKPGSSTKLFVAEREIEQLGPVLQDVGFMPGKAAHIPLLRNFQKHEDGQRYDRPA